MVKNNTLRDKSTGQFAGSTRGAKKIPTAAPSLPVSRATSTPSPSSSSLNDQGPLLGAGPLTTSELYDARSEVVYPTGSNRTNESVREYNRQISALEKQWSRWLGEEHAPGIPEVAQNKIFSLAWQEGHSSGYNEVETHYVEIAEIAVITAEAIRSGK